MEKGLQKKLSELLSYFILESRRYSLDVYVYFITGGLTRHTMQRLLTLLLEHGFDSHQNVEAGVRSSLQRV